MLVKGGFRDQHFNAGSLLLGLGVTLSVGGCLNTWMRTGRLFPGPHLWAGAGENGFVSLYFVVFLVHSLISIYL